MLVGAGRLPLLALVVLTGAVGASVASSAFLPTLATASLALLAWAAATSPACSTVRLAASLTRSLPTVTVLLTSPVRRWTPGFSRSDLAASTIFW